MNPNGVRLDRFRQQMLIQPESLPDPTLYAIAIYGPAEQLFWSNEPEHTTLLRVFIDAEPTQQGRFLKDG
jgi:hypothetical protein